MLIRPNASGPDFVGAPEYAAEVTNRYNSLTVKAFSITRTILGFDIEVAGGKFNPEVPYIQIAFRSQIDNTIGATAHYGLEQSFTDMVRC